MFEILSLMEKEHKAAAPEPTIRQRSRSGNNVVRKHKRAAEKQQRQQRSNKHNIKAAKAAKKQGRQGAEATKKQRQQRQQMKARDNVMII